MNATVRENILFGRPFDEARYWKVVEEACLFRESQFRHFVLSSPLVLRRVDPLLT